MPKITIKRTPKRKITIIRDQNKVNIRRKIKNNNKNMESVIFTV